MDLYILRHAIAFERGTPEYADNDAERPLTGKGIERMRRGARGIRRMGLEFERILSSPYTRARQTAEIVVDVLGADDALEFFKPLEAEVPPEQAVAELAARHGGASSLMLVGHEPQLSAIASILLSGSPDLDLELKKGGLLKLRTGILRPVQCATLEWWLKPAHLRMLAG